MNICGLVAGKPTYNMAWCTRPNADGQPTRRYGLEVWRWRDVFFFKFFVQ